MPRYLPAYKLALAQVPRMGWYEDIEAFRAMAPMVLVGLAKVKIEFDDYDLDLVQYNTPIVTGRLFDSWRVRGNFLVNICYYSGFVEYGHKQWQTGRWVPGQFMLNRAIRDITDRHKAQIKEQLETQQILPHEMIIKLNL